MRVPIIVKISLTALFHLICTMTVIGQIKWKHAANNVGVGYMFRKWQFEKADIVDRLKNKADMPDLNGFSKGCEPYCTHFEVPPIFLHHIISFSPYNIETKEYNRKREWRIGLAALLQAHTLSFTKENFANGDTLAYQVLNFQDKIVSVSIEMGHYWNTEKYKKWNFAGGFGSRIGLNFTPNIQTSTLQGLNLKGDILSSNDSYQTLKAKNTVLWRIFSMGGIYYSIKEHLHLCIESELGIAYRQVLSGKAYIRPHLGLILGTRFVW